MNLEHEAFVRLYLSWQDETSDAHVVDPTGGEQAVIERHVLGRESFSNIVQRLGAVAIRKHEETRGASLIHLGLGVSDGLRQPCT